MQAAHIGTEHESSSLLLTLPLSRLGRDTLKSQANRRTYVSLWLNRSTEATIHEFFCDHGFRTSVLSTGLHITIYQSDLVLPRVENAFESLEITVDTAETRFMTMTIGGIVKRDHLNPSDHRIGIRLTRRNQAIDAIDRIRRHYVEIERKHFSQDRKPSTLQKSSFGSPVYVPHVTLLKPDNGATADLTTLGTAFRERFAELAFHQLRVQVDR